VIPRFALARPTTIDEAFEAFAAAGGDAAWYAGGTELLQVMKMGLASFGTLIDLKRLPELTGISVDGDGALVIGGGVTHRQIERDDVIRREAPALAALEGHGANIRVRNQGTIGGNLCFAEPHSDPATFLLACDARVRLRGRNGARELPIGEFVLDPLVTAREEDEILLSVVVPTAGAAEGRAYEKAKFRERPAVSVAVRVRADGGQVVDAQVAVGSMTDRPMMVPDAAAALVGLPADGSGADGAFGRASDALGELDAVGDLDGSPDYKRHLAAVLLGRATRAALAEATARA
jgi:aerobic carbon-monoxide dehydrogenase medium subunit